MHLGLLILLSLALLPKLAHAYVGPGLGAGAIGAVLGVIGALLLAIFAVVYYPIKRALRKRASAKKAKPAGNTDDKAAGLDR
jgi:membrane protein implicated in regulation of membrane protease activity